MNRTLRTLKARTQAVWQSPSGQRWIKAVRLVLIGGIAGWLVYQLSGIGWREVWASRPRTPWFYVLWAALYLQLPLVQAAIYRVVWGLPVREGLLPIFQKRALNQDVVSYSGEAFFFAWARKRPSLSTARVAGTIKDNAIASSLGSWAAAVLVVGGFLFGGQIAFADLLGNQDPLYVGFAAVGLAVLVGVGLHFRRTLFTLSPRVVAGLFAAHVGRFVLLIYPLQILQWWAVLPDVPLSTWATMLAVLTLVNRLPLIPAKDLAGIGAVLGMTDLLAASSAAIAAMLLVHSALNKALNALLFVGASFIERRRARKAAVASGEDPEADPEAAAQASEPARR